MKTTESNVFVMIDTCNNEGLNYQEYLDYCDANDVEPAAEDSDDYYEWLNETAHFIWENFIDGTIYCKCNYPLLITGNLGLWTGNHDIMPVLVESEGYVSRGNYYDQPSLKKAIMKCFGDCDDIKITYNDGVIEVDAIHHDGTNHFCIRKLSNTGYENAQNEDWAVMEDDWFEPIGPDDMYE